MKKRIIPAIIARNQEELIKRIKKVKKNSKYIQLDFMDGKFVPNKSLDFKFKLPKWQKYEAHLMINNPENWIQENYKKMHLIIFHAESLKNSLSIVRTIRLIKSKKRKVGIAINPKTPLSRIKPYLDDVDLVLILTVKPGKYGSEFLKSPLRKVRELRKKYPELEIEVDGGITNKTISKVNESGANRFVVGSFLQRRKDSKKAIEELREQI